MMRNAFFDVIHTNKFTLKVEGCTATVDSTMQPKDDSLAVRLVSGIMFPATTYLMQIPHNCGLIEWFGLPYNITPDIIEIVERMAGMCGYSYVRVSTVLHDHLDVLTTAGFRRRGNFLNKRSGNRVYILGKNIGERHEVAEYFGEI
jgi:hypothetical protein